MFDLFYFLGHSTMKILTPLFGYQLHPCSLLWLQIATETSLSEKAKLEQRVEDLESMSHELEAERSEFILRVNALKDDTRSLEDQVKDLATRLTDAQDAASQNKSNATQMK